jgi:hypothetical protein
MAGRTARRTSLSGLAYPSSVHQNAISSQMQETTDSPRIARKLAGWIAIVIRLSSSSS